MRSETEDGKKRKGRESKMRRKGTRRGKNTRWSKK
jgi:hypothetical protein